VFTKSGTNLVGGTEGTVAKKVCVCIMQNADEIAKIMDSVYTIHDSFYGPLIVLSYDNVYVVGCGSWCLFI
jgi:DNA polymerase III alpha subunit (gram-positive type)